MSSGKNPLVLMMALSVPGAAHSLGLGEIHVDSGLNERLAAEIDIVGANPVELAGLRAAVASREMFQRYGADRPAFLSSATFKVTQDSQGRPVLAVRSTDSFTEPVVNLVVDLNWGHGQLVRQYTLLLDPAGFASPVPAPAPSTRLAASNIPSLPDVPAAPPAATPVVETKTQTVARQADPPADQSDKTLERTVRKTTHLKVGARATLRGVAWRVGERSESDLQRMMIAIFRANPTAFDGNINRLHRGAVLTIPSHAEAATITRAAATREVHAHMAAWRAPARALAANGAMASTPVAAPVAATTAAPPVAAALVPAPAAGAPLDAGVTSSAIDKASDMPGTQALGRRVQSLEQELTEMKGLLESERDQLTVMQQQAALIGQRPPAVGPQTVNPPSAQPKRGYAALVPVATGLGLLSAALAAIYVGLRRRMSTLKGSRHQGAAAPPDAIPASTLPANALPAEALPVDAFPGEAFPADAWPAEASAAAAEDTAILEMIAADAALADDRARAPLDGSSRPGQEPIHSQTSPFEDDATYPLLPAMSAAPAGRSEISVSAVASSRATAQQVPTGNQHTESVSLRRMEPTRLDYNLLDLDMTAQHVQMPSVLNEHAVVKERRTNLADVLKLAIEREPDRHDLRMKLLELYYSAAATNRKAFLEVVQKFARDSGHMQAGEWEKIAFMGRQIASDNPLFTQQPVEDDDLADCA
jgi:pilus assembly protein FimV